MPTVTRPPTAGASEPNFWRNSTARAGESANGWSLTTSRASTSEPEIPSRVAFDFSQLRAAVTGAPATVPREPLVGAIEAGVPSEFHRTFTDEPSALALPSWAAVGATVPRTSRSSRPAGVSPSSWLLAVAGASGAAPAPGACARPRVSAVAEAAASAVMECSRRDMGCSGVRVALPATCRVNARPAPGVTRQ